MQNKREVQNEASGISSVIVQIGIGLIIVIEYFVRHTLMFELVALLMFSLSIEKLYCYRKTKEKIQLHTGILFLGLTVFAIIEMLI